MEQIEAIRAKEIYEGALAASRAQAERVKEGSPQSGPTQLASGSSTPDPPATCEAPPS